MRCPRANWQRPSIWRRASQGYEQLLRLLQALQKTQPEADDESGTQHVAYAPEIDEADSYWQLRSS